MTISNKNRLLVCLPFEKIVSLNAIIISTYSFYNMDKKVLRVIGEIIVFFLAKGAIIADERVASLVDMHVA